MTPGLEAVTPRKAPAVDQEHIFRALVESVRDYAIFILDPNGVVSTWNPGAERLKQYKADEIIGQHFSIFYPEVDKKNDKPGMELREAARVGRFEDEGWRLRKDGSRFWANVVITAIRDKNGELLGFGKITRDLTERRAAEQRIRLLIEAVTDYAIYSLDPNGIITSWNSGAQRIKNYSAEEIIGKHFSVFYTPEDALAGMPQKVLKTAREQGHFEGEGWRVRKDGTRFWSSGVVTPLYDEEGTLTGFSKITRDITDRKQLMDELQQHARELELQIAERERAHAELEAFSYSVSHDLRAQLRAVEGFAAALEEDYGDQLDSGAKDYLREIQHASTRMTQLVKDLLDYGRLGRMEILPQPVALRQLLKRVIEETNAPNGVIKVTGVEKDTAVWAHETTLAQALANLLTNALKFQKPGIEPRVKITVAPGERANMLRIAVTDNGIGIAQHHHERIFKVFERLHGVEQYPGTGIGLAIVKRGIERMNGKVGVNSTLGEGSTFWVELPMVKGRAE